MKVKKYQSTHQRTILTGMILHDGVLERIQRHLGGERTLFDQKWLDIPARWCLDYFAKYGKAPKKVIQSLFVKFAETNKDEETVKTLEGFLSDLSRDYVSLKKEQNEDYIVDLACDHFRKVRLKRIIEQGEAALENEDLEEAEAQIAGYQKIDFSSSAWKDPFSDEAIQIVNNKERLEPIVQFKGDLGIFLSNFKRGKFFSFLAPDKRGKSYWLQEVAYQALRQRRKVLYYILGDMSEEDIYERLHCRVLRRPWEKDKEILIPTRLKPITVDGKQTFDLNVRKETREKLQGDRKSVKLAREKLLKVTGYHEISLKVKVDGGHSIPASQIESDVKDFSLKQGWVPDVVVVDYADEIAPEPASKGLDLRHQEWEKWRILRRLSLKMHCLVVTASQAASSSYKDKWVLDRSDFSEDKRKNAIVSGMIGINQNNHEKENGVYRLNWVVCRDGKWTNTKVVWCGGNLDIASPCIISSF